MSERRNLRAAPVPATTSPLFDAGTTLEEASAILRGVLAGLEDIIEQWAHGWGSGEQNHLRILVDRFDSELTRIEATRDVVYDLGAREARA